MLKKPFQALLVVFAVLVAMGIWSFSWLMLGKVLPYFQFEHAYGFLSTKTDAVLEKSHFQTAFYIHITSSLVVIVAGVLQFFPSVLRRWPRFHRIAGMIYLGSILLLAAPSGLVLGFYANGGLSSKTGFVLQSIVWWVLTYLAWHEIRCKRYVMHSEMMIRSFAITLAAMSLRTESYVMYYFFETKPIETYLTVTWLSWVGNLLIAEALIYLGLGKFLIKQAQFRT